MPDMQAPAKVTINCLDDYLDAMSKVVFQSGMSWKVVDAKWDGIREAFNGFQLQAVAAMSEQDLDELATDPRVIRNRRKLGAIVHNAQTMIRLDTEHGGFANYLRSQPDYESQVKDIRKQFKFVGDTGCYCFLYVVGEEVPPHDDWMRSRGRY